MWCQSSLAPLIISQTCSLIGPHVVPIIWLLNMIHVSMCWAEQQRKSTHAFIMDGMDGMTMTSQMIPLLHHHHMLSRLPVFPGNSRRPIVCVTLSLNETSCVCACDVTGAGVWRTNDSARQQHVVSLDWRSRSDWRWRNKKLLCSNQIWSHFTKFYIFGHLYFLQPLQGLNFAFFIFFYKICILLLCTVFNSHGKINSAPAVTSWELFPGREWVNARDWEWASET